MEINALKRRLEELRLRPFTELVPIDQIPCHETSDAEKLCKSPLVSVLMITYNHADNIRRAIEGVMAQKTDFPFELIVGEDASQDETRQICFEMQKKYPERIRVLWSESNVNAISGNGRRVRRAARGEFLAYCEGDDVWIRPDKLQRQIDFLRQNPSVGVCLGGTEVEFVADGKIEPFPYGGKGERIVDGKTFVKTFLGNGDFGDFSYTPSCFQTSGYAFRRSAATAAQSAFPEAYRWNWCFNDLILLTTVAMVSDVGFVLDGLSRYRMTGTNATATQGANLLLDGRLYNIYLRTQGLGASFDEALKVDARRIRRHLGRIFTALPPGEQRQMAERIEKFEDLRTVFLRSGYRGILPYLQQGTLTKKAWKRISRLGRLCELIGL